MKRLIEKEKSERGKAIFEIILMVVSVAAFSYFIGNEFQVVSAISITRGAGNPGTTPNECLWSSGTNKRSCSTCTPPAGKTCTCGEWCLAPSDPLCKAGGHTDGCWSGGCACDPATIKDIATTTGSRSCSDLLGVLCNSGQTCSTGAIPDSSDSTGGKFCCIGTCKDATTANNGGQETSLADTAKNALTAAAANKIASMVFPAPAAPAAAEAAKAAAAAAGHTGPEEALIPDAAKAAAGGTQAGLEWGKLELSVQNGWFTIAANAAIAVGIYYLVKGIGSWLSPDTPKLFDYLATGASIAYGVGAIIGLFFPHTLAIFGLAGTGFGLILVPIGMLIAYLFYTEEYIAAVQFTCSPWQPVIGGANCDACNKEGLGCTQYKCQSLGLACELLNPNTDKQVCYWVDKNNIAPPTISAWDGPLDKTKFKYVPDTARLPPDKGVIIEYIGSGATADGAVPPFSILNFGISLDIPGACRMSMQRTDSYDKMTYPGDLSQGYSLFNHTITFPTGPGNTTGASAGNTSLPNGGNYEVFIRCQSKQYSNSGTFVFKFKVNSEPDITAPEIVSADPPTGMPIPIEQHSKNIYLYVNKPSECRWSHSDEDYDTMPGIMTGPTNAAGMGTNMLYTYSATLDGLKDGVDNLFYFRCKSYPENADKDRYKNEESYPYKLVGTRSLVIDNITVNGLSSSGQTIKDATNSVKVTILATTSAGYKNGEAQCALKKAAEEKYVIFGDTNSYQSTQDLQLAPGSYGYSIKCCDLGGNCQTQPIDFTIETDIQSPIVTRAYYNEGSNLNVMTDESSQCVYDTTSCSYNFDDGLKMTSSDGINHLTAWNTANTYYIKCKDAFGNQPNPDECSITIRPFNSV